MASNQPDFSRRQSQLRSKLKKESAGAMLITSPVNVTWLTGFTGDSSYVFINREELILLSDTRFETQIRDQVPNIETVIRDTNSTQTDSVVAVCKSHRPESLVIASAHLSHLLFLQLEEALNCPLVDSENWVEQLRMIKDRSEIEKIRESIRINERAFQVIRSELTGDQTELQIAHNLEHQIRRFGGSRCAFHPIVGVGPRSALPHGEPSSAAIAESAFVLIDWGAQVDGYASDLTRILVTARIPAKIRKIYEIVLAAQAAAIRKIRPGVTFKSVDQAARTVISKAGFGSKFGHGLGHGIGLEVHELPFVSPVREGTFQTNMVLTVEPGIYLPDIGGIRIEDNVLVTRTGVEVLSSLPKSLEESTVEI